MKKKVRKYYYETIMICDVCGKEVNTLIQQDKEDKQRCIQCRRDFKHPEQNKE